MVGRSLDSWTLRSRGPDSGVRTRVPAGCGNTVAPVLRWMMPPPWCRAGVVRAVCGVRGAYLAPRAMCLVSFGLIQPTALRRP